MLRKRFFSTFRVLQHDNPLGLPRSGTPPSFPRRRGLPEKRKIRDVKKIIAVSSAKGGVGKSTIAVNLALSFARRGIRTGILDTDIFGPSIPTLLNLSGEPRLDENNCLLPLTNYGLKSMSMGYLLPQPTPSPEDPSTIPMDTTPISWRGLMVTKAMHQLLHSVSWGPLDVLFLDLPPEIIVDGAVIVSTPQDIALRDAVRGYGMFQKMGIPVLGMVRNMAFFACPQCGHQTKIFSHGDKSDGSEHSHQAEDWGVVAECKRLGVEFLGDIPLDARVCEDADRGMPTVVAEESQDRSVRRKAF
ncbi:iron-sulfur protein IND1 [Aspergillus arachidicola]|uniref:Iron-sulfur protein IND1 n=1 Tax=Aspergillus arachidicola TaxID=656916 RepID=A0A2G7FFX5_9EURO|nr:iron-sulfur protein IND1 [Aspergillus arachidicola]